MFCLLGLLLLAGPLISAMRLPLVSPIEGFTKADEFLLSTRYVYGMTPRLFCTTSRLVIFDHTVFEEELAKVKSDSAKKTPNKSGRRGRRQQSVKALPNPAGPDTITVQTKCVSTSIFPTALAETYGRLLALMRSTRFDGFYGASIENISPESYMVHVFFAHDCSEEVVSQVTTVLSPDAYIFVPSLDLNQVSFQVKPVKDMRYNWELRNHFTGKLLFSTGNKDTLNRMIEWSRAENLWDLILVREGEFEKMRSTGLSFAIGVYNRNTFHIRVIDHVDLVEMRGNKFMKFNLSCGFEDVLGFYFFKDVSSRPEEMAISSILYHQENENKKSFGKVVAMESYNIGLEQFMVNHLMHDKPALTPETMPVPTFMRFRQSKVADAFPIKSLADFLGIGQTPWARCGISWSPHDKLVLNFTERTLSAEVPYTLFYVVMFREAEFPLVFLRLYQLLLADYMAWWVPCIKSITVSPKMHAEKGYLGLLDLTFIFHKDARMNGWDVPKFLAEFILTACGDAALFSGLIDNKTGKSVSVSQDKNNVIPTCLAPISNSVFRLPGPNNVFRSDEDAKEFVPNRVALDPALKQVFEAISLLEWECEFRRLGPPQLFFEHSFQKYLGLTHSCRSFGIMSEWIRQKGSARTHCFTLARQRVPEMLAAVGTFVIGDADIFGTTFLGCMFEFDTIPTMSPKDYDPAHDFIFTLLTDPAAGPEKLVPLVLMLGMAEDKPLEVYTRFLSEDFLEDNGATLQLSSPWLVKIDDEAEKIFTNYYALEHFVSWMEPSILPKLSLLKVSDDIDHGYDGPVLYLAVCHEDVFEMVFALDSDKIGIPGKQVWELVQQISFKTHPKVDGMILIGYHLRPGAQHQQFEEVIEARIQWLFLAKAYELGLVEKMHVALRIGSKYETTLSSFAELESKVLEFPNLQVGDQAIIWNSQYKLPCAGKYRAYHILIDFDSAPQMLIRGIQFLAGTFGGFWKDEFLSVHLRPVLKKGNAEETDYELIWTFQNIGKIDDHDYLTVLAKVLLLCGCLSPEYSIGTYNFKNGQFSTVKAIEGIVDEYLMAIHGMMTLSLPDWMKRKQAEENAEANRLYKAQMLAVAQEKLDKCTKLAQDEQEALEKAQEVCKEKLVLLQATELIVKQKTLALETAAIQVQDHELQVRAEEVKLKQAKAQLNGLRKAEIEQEMTVQHLCEEEERLDLALALHQPSTMEPPKTVGINEEQTGNLKNAVKSSRRRWPMTDF